MGLTAEELKEWAEKIATEKSQEYLSRVTYKEQVADTKQGMRSYIASFFGARRAPTETTPKSEEVQKQQQEEDDQMDSFVGNKV